MLYIDDAILNRLKTFVLFLDLIYVVINIIIIDYEENITSY